MTKSGALWRVPRQPGACALLLASLLCLPLHSHAATPALAARTAPAIPTFFTLTHNRPRNCGPAAGVLAPPPGWREVSLSCAWKGMLQMRRWEARPIDPALACAGRAAQWWAWARPRFGLAPDPAGAAWHDGWRTNSLSAASGATRSIAIIDSGDGGAAVATEWRWTPSPRADTRAWQEGQWKLLAAAAALHPPAGAGQVPAAAAALGRAWERNLNGRAGLAAAEGWVWRSDRSCLRMVAQEPSEAQLHLPYSPEDTRIEQRAAMQVQLARRHPNASWLVPFRLFPPGTGTSRGAIYEAIWSEPAQLTGQLWIPTKDDGQIVRARIALRAPAGLDNAAQQTLERELAGIVASWRAQHE